MGANREVITVDGVCASGKSALAKLLAERLGFAHLNSGLLYRAAGLLVSQIDGVIDNTHVGKLVRDHTIELRYDGARGSHILIDGIQRDSELTTQEISRLASQVAKLPSVRSHFVDIQRNAFAPLGVVAEGRDMGTVIFPDAQTKFFVNADIIVRASRRCKQLADKGEIVPLEEIQDGLAVRDREDATRDVSPMRAAEGAVLIDNSHGSLDEVVERMYQAVRAKRP